MVRLLGTPMNLLKCRICGHGEAKSLGQIPDCGEFAGQQISPPIKGGELWLCKYCGSMFRHPTLSPNEYISLYKEVPDTVWVGSEAERNDFATIYEYLKNHAGGGILDVGCYTGAFLAGLPDKFKKFGVEPSYLAAASAASKGINVLGKTLEEVDTDRVFDVVVSIDVIEHVLDAEIFLNQALAHVRENGLLIISTGNPGCFFWKRVIKSKFWYNLFAEHVTFPSYKYYLEFSSRHGLLPPEQMRFRYLKFRLMKRLSIFLRYVLSSLSPALYQTLRRCRGRLIGNDDIAKGVRISLAGVFADHHVISFKKKRL